VVAAPTCQDFTFPLYFQAGSDQITREGLQVIDSNAGRAIACPGAMVQVTGLADSAGDAAANLQLSQRRAVSVGQALAARGYPTPAFEGQGAAGSTTAAGRNEPLRRRAEVSVRFPAAPTAR
jgi:outer membrane protein OmpA-like peptidoglycan-associated protein